MGKLYLMTTIVDRKTARKYQELYRESGQNVMFSVQEEEHWQTVKKQLQKKLRIDAPGGGIAFIIPLSSIGGKKVLQFLLEKEDYQKEEESTLKDTVHELIIVIANQGNIELVMDAARGAGAYGGTVIRNGDCRKIHGSIHSR